MKTFVNKEASCAWLRSAGLKGETESLIKAAQDQTLNIRYHQRMIFKKQIDGNCGKAQETESHITAGCTVLASTEYLHRHNRVASYVYWVVCLELGFEVPNKWYEHTPWSMVNINEITILWNHSIITDRKILANRPDVVIHDRKSKSWMLIDISVPDDKNIALKEAEKMIKYKDLEIEINRMWNVETKVVPVVVGALGIEKRLRERSGVDTRTS